MLYLVKTFDGNHENERFVGIFDDEGAMLKMFKSDPEYFGFDLKSFKEDFPTEEDERCADMYDLDDYMKYTSIEDFTLNYDYSHEKQIDDIAI